MATAPSDLTGPALNGTTGDQLRFWIQKANEGVGKRVLNKTGKVKDLKSRLADYYGLDRSAPLASSAPVVGPLSVDKDIQKRQWAHLRDLGMEWQQTSRAGHAFKLCAPSEGEYPPVSHFPCVLGKIFNN